VRGGGSSGAIRAQNASGNSSFAMAPSSMAFLTPQIETELHPYMATVFRGLNSPSLAIDGNIDHVHILFSLGRVIAIADLVQEVKTETSKWIKRRVRSSATSIGSGAMRPFLLDNQMCQL
jgi:hypothetical protein